MLSITLNETFITEEKAEQCAMINIKDDIPKTGPMTDSGISLRSSMSSNLPNSRTGSLKMKFNVLKASKLPKMQTTLTNTKC